MNRARGGQLELPLFLSLFQPDVEADGRAGEVEVRAELVFEKALIAEVHGLGLVGEEHKRGRRGCGRADL